MTGLPMSGLHRKALPATWIQIGLRRSSDFADRRTMPTAVHLIVAFFSREIKCFYREKKRFSKDFQKFFKKSAAGMPKTIVSHFLFPDSFEIFPEDCVDSRTLRRKYKFSENYLYMPAGLPICASAQECFGGISERIEKTPAFAGRKKSEEAVMNDKNEKKMKNAAAEFIRTDLAAECKAAWRPESEDGVLPGVRYAEEKAGESGEITLARLTVEKGAGEDAIGKPAGEYVTVSFGRLWLSDEGKQEETVEVIAAELRRMAARLAPGVETVLVAGLGNRQLTVDAIGSEVAASVTVTGHLREMEPALYEALGQKCVCALSPGVLGQTGIESAVLLESAVKETGAGLVIAVDALAARSTDRLCSTVQITDAGICPGSGVGNARKAVTQESLGVPVIALGVPTVADSSTLVYDALEKAGIEPEEIREELRQVLEQGRGFFVSVKESDIALRSLAGVIADALDRALER